MHQRHVQLSDEWQTPNGHMVMRFRGELSVDLYELTISQVFWRRGMKDRATFSLFFRGYPSDRGYYIACGIDDALDFLNGFRFSERDIEAIRRTTPLSDDFIDHLSGIRFTGNVRAVPEGSIVFADEPLLEVSGNLLESQIVETMLLNIVTTSSLLATKASRLVKAASGRPVVDFGTRRTHGENAALQAARSGYVAGFAGTSNVKAAAMFEIPAVGTMAHSFIQAFGDEREAFDVYIDEFPDTTTLLVDTYDTLTGVEKAIRVAQTARIRGDAVNAIRLDSGDLDQLSRSARSMLDSAGLQDVRILASGGLDEFSIENLVQSCAPIDAFGVGTRYGTSADAPYIDSVYKLVEIGGRPVTKLSAAKATRPWAKQVFRRFEDGLMSGDVLARATSAVPDGYPHQMLRTAMQSGERLNPMDPIETVRKRVASNIAALPEQFRRLRDPALYRIGYSQVLNIPNNTRQSTG